MGSSAVTLMRSMHPAKGWSHRIYLYARSGLSSWPVNLLLLFFRIFSNREKLFSEYTRQSPRPIFAISSSSFLSASSGAEKNDRVQPSVLARPRTSNEFALSRHRRKAHRWRLGRTSHRLPTGPWAPKAIR